MKWNKLIAIIMMIIVLGLLVVFTVEVVKLFYPPVTWEATEVYPMANAHITWDQTYHSGAWSETVKGRK